MKEDRTPVKSSAIKENEPVVENGKKKNKEERPATKVVVRRLPPSMTEEQFKLQVSPLPDIDYFYFVPADMSLMPNAFSRAYINFVNQPDLFIFTQKFDGYVFVDNKGGEFPAVVEFAPFQRIPKNRPNRKKDPKVGTIELDPVYIAFKEQLEAAALENKTSVNASKQHFFETSLVPEKKEVNNTPLLDFIKTRRAEKQRIRDEKREEKRKKDLERRRAKEEQRRTKKDDDTSVLKTSLPSPDHCKPKSPEKPLVFPNIYDTGVKEIDENKNEKHHNGSSSSGNEITVQEIPIKVQELVKFLNKQIENYNKDIEKSTEKNIVPVNCKNHKDIEAEMIKNVINKVDEQTKRVKSPKHITQHSKKMTKCPVPNVHFNETNNMKPYYSAVPLIRPRDKMFVPYSTRTYKSNNIGNVIIRPIRIANPSHQNVKKECNLKADDDKFLYKTNISGAILKKNLQNVVENVLGNTEIKYPKENVLNKPKTFMMRVLDGSGEQYMRQGFNSTSFYLPPRNFGFGKNEPINMTLKKDATHDVIKHNAQSPKPLRSISSAKGHFPSFSRKTLPPFSKKPIFLSKSDGDIENIKNDVKVGGSQESIIKKFEPWILEVKPQLPRRPNIAPKKSMIIGKNSKVTF